MFTVQKVKLVIGSKSTHFVICQPDDAVWWWPIWTLAGNNVLPLDENPRNSSFPFCSQNNFDLARHANERELFFEISTNQARQIGLYVILHCCCILDDRTASIELIHIRVFERIYYFFYFLSIRPIIIDYFVYFNSIISGLKSAV